MPERIETARIARIEPDYLELNDEFPGTYGFVLRLDSDPGTEWAVEFDAVYQSVNRPGKPPIIIHGDRMTIYYLSRYSDELPDFLRFLTQAVAETNRSVELRNSVLPDEEKEKQAFRQKLRDLSRTFPEKEGV